MKLDSLPSGYVSDRERAACGDLRDHGRLLASGWRPVKVRGEERWIPPGDLGPAVSKEEALAGLRKDGGA